MASFQPISGQLSEKQAAHLLRRATFGPSVSDIKAFTGQNISSAVDSLFSGTSPVHDPPLDLKTGQTWLNPRSVDETNSDQNSLQTYFMIWHLEQIRKSGINAHERITYFYHTHLPTRRSIVTDSEAIYYQNTLFRKYAFGSFKELFRFVCIDNAMLVYLDGATNDYQNPNENFAREMFELYTIGKGQQVGEGDYTTFTEQDVKEAAKVLSGYEYDQTFTQVDATTGIPRGKVSLNGTQARKHHPGTKTFSARFGGVQITSSELDNGYATESAVFGELDELIDMIFAQDETARFICRKLYRHFVYFDITSEIETDIIGPMATILKNNNYNISETLKHLFKSQHFYDADNAVTTDNNMGAMIKSPIDIIIGTLRFFAIPLPEQLQALYTNAYQNGILKWIFDQGLSFYEPYEVAGYPAYHQMPAYHRNWITPTTLAYRYYFSDKLIQGLDEGTSYTGFAPDLISWVKDANHVSNPADAEEIVQAFINYFIAIEVTQERFDYFLNVIFLDTLSPLDWEHEWNNFITSSDATIVKGKLEVLLSALIQTPEFQLY